MKYLIFIFLSILSINTFAAGGSFGGGGASGSWGEPEQCPAQFLYQHGYLTTSDQSAACALALKETPFSGMYSAINWPKGTNQTGLCRFTNKSTGSPTTLNGITVNLVLNSNYDPSCEEKCPVGYEKDSSGKCQPKKCPVGETLVNGQCQKKQCPAGQALDANGNCMPRDDQCPAGQIMVNGRCSPDPNKDDDPPPEGSEWPPFCEWASEMCQWHKEWQQWSNDYAANEEKANLDREELKRLGLDSKEQLTEINSKQEAIKEAIQNNSLTLDKIKDQDKIFYDELRLWLNNFDPEQGSPSEQYPPVEFPKFCDWSVQVCNWYLDWKDWRTDYNAHNLTLQEKFAEHLERLKEIKEQDALAYEKSEDHYKESKSFFDDVREFFDWYKNQEDEPLPEPEQPTEQPEPTYPQPDDNQRVNWQESCPLTQADQTIVIDGVSTTIKGFDMSEACSMASKMRPLILLAGALISVLIIARGHS